MLGTLTFLLVVAGGIAILWFAVGPRKILDMLGPADLGPADFATMFRSRTPNDAFAAPDGFERADVLRPELVSPVIEATPAAVYEAVLAIAETTPDVETVARDDGKLHARFVARTATMRWPDTVDVKVITVGAGRVSLLIYSRAKFGLRDFGVNRARIEALLKALASRFPVVR